MSAGGSSRMDAYEYYEAESEDMMIDKLSLDVHDGAPFQSMMALTSNHMLSQSSIRSIISRLVSNIEATLTNTQIHFHDSEKHAINNHVYRCVRKMIFYEKQAWSQDYFVFYRTVSEKYILYEFNTMMLDLFNSVSSAATERRPNEIICASSLDESDFVQYENLEAVLHHFEGKPYFSDVSHSAQPILLSVNNSLVINKMNDRFHKYRFNSEANPLYFPLGYEGSFQWTADLIRFMQTFFEIENGEAKEIMEDLVRMYSAQFDPDSTVEGHMIQIFIPSKILHEFVYLAMDYGKPVNVYRSMTRNSTGFHTYHSYPMFGEPIIRPPADFEPVDIANVLRSQWGSHLQSRIIGHPNLFLKRGALANVYHGTPTFDAVRFRNEMMRRLQPYILKAQSKGKRLNYCLY